MRKKLMLLVFILPIVLVIVAFAISSSVLIEADIPVSSIDILSGKEQGFIYLDYVNPYENNLLKVEVYPKNAKNKGYSIDVTPDKGQTSNCVSIDEDGYINVENVGKSIVTVKSNDGGFTASRLVIVSSSKPTDILPILIQGENKSLIDGPITLDTKEHYLYLKSAPKNLDILNPIYEVEDPTVLEISAFGKINVKKAGSTKVNVSYLDGANGRITKELSFVTTGTTQLDAPKAIQTQYDRQYDTELIIKGGVDTECFIDGIKSSSYTWSVDKSNVRLTPNGNRCKVIAPSGVDFKLTLQTIENGEVIKYERNAKTIEYVKDIRFDKQYEDFGFLNFYTLGDTKIVNNAYENYLNLNLLKEKNYKYESVDTLPIEYTYDKSLVDIDFINKKVNIKTQEDEIINIKARYKYDKYFGEKTEANIKVKFIKDGVDIFNFDDLKKATDESKKVVLMEDVDLYTPNMTEAELRNTVGKNLMKTTQNWQFYENEGILNGTKNNRPSVMYCIEFKASVYGNGHSISANNITTATYESKIGSNRIYLPFFNGPLDFVAMSKIDEENRKLSAAAVKGQDNISFLVREDNVLIDNVNLRACDDEYLIEDGKFNLNKLNKVGTTLEILGDKVEVRNARVSNGRSVIRVYGGKDTNPSRPGNPILYKYELDDLQKRADYLELMEEERITVNINNSLIKNGREFLVKVGSNRGLQTFYNPNNNKRTIYPLYSSAKDALGNLLPYKPQNLNEQEARPEFAGAKEPTILDTYFYNNYVTTDLTIEDSVLKDSGLFTVGVETGFSGQFLDGVKAEGPLGNILGNLLPTWHDLAVTSFPSILRLKGQVELLDWKKLSNLNGDTLIESDAQGISDFLKLDFVKMINSVRNIDHSYDPLIDEYLGEQYVHGGIAFYGGGFNYSLIDLRALKNSSYLGEYKINLNILEKAEDAVGKMQGQALPLAAGIEDFTFYMYGKDNSSYLKTKERIDDGSAYRAIKGKEK